MLYKEIGILVYDGKKFETATYFVDGKKGKEPGIVSRIRMNLRTIRRIPQILRAEEQDPAKKLQRAVKNINWDDVFKQ